MKQLQFLGRTALDDTQRQLLRLAGPLAEHHESGYDISSFLEELGATLEDVQRVANDPTAIYRTKGAAADLFETLARGRACPALIGDARSFAGLVADIDEFILDRCALDEDEGSFEIALFTPESGIGVGDGDDFLGGVTLHGHSVSGTLTVAPRIVRQICTNGMTEATDRTGQCIYTRDALGQARGDMDAALRSGFSRERVQAVVAQVKTLERQPAADPVLSLQRARVSVPSSTFARLRRVFDENGDSTEYGVLNAVTQVARDAGSVSERVRLEASAGRFALVTRHAPTAHGCVQLVNQ